MCFLERGVVLVQLGCRRRGRECVGGQDAFASFNSRDYVLPRHHNVWRAFTPSLYLDPLPLPRGKPLARPARPVPLLALPAFPPRLLALLCFIVDVVLGVTEGAIVLRRGVAFRLVKLASAVMNVASASPVLPSPELFCKMVVSSIFPCP